MKKCNIKILCIAGTAALIVVAAVILSSVSVGIIGGNDGPTSVYVK